MEIISLKNIEWKVDFHLKHKIPYTMEISGTSGRKVLKSERGQYTSMHGGFNPREMGFIKAVKNYVIKNNLHNTIPNNFKEESDKDRIMYYAYNKKYKAGDELEGGIWELDLTHAYFEKANKLGLLSQELYDLGSGKNKEADKDKNKEQNKKKYPIRKKARLASIGTLAKKTRKIVFDGVKEINMGLSEPSATEFLWDTICYDIGEIMMQASKESGKDFIFFWVDAIFVKEAAKDKVEQIFESFGYKSKPFRCEWLRFDERNVIVKSTENIKEKFIKGQKVFRDERRFPFSTDANRKII